MELSNIEKLLEKYFEGATTLSEEQELKAYFAGESVAPHLEKYKSMFQYFLQEESTTAAIDFDPGTRNTSWYKWVGVAASIALIAGIFYSRTPEVIEPVDTYESPEIAFQKTKEVLDLVSKYMNEGTEDLVYLKEFENTKNKFLK